jgi:hypothetical protein
LTELGFELRASHLVGRNSTKVLIFVFVFLILISHTINFLLKNVPRKPTDKGDNDAVIRRKCLLLIGTTSAKAPQVGFFGIVGVHLFPD